MNWFANLATRSKLIVGLGILTVLLAAAIVAALVALKSERASYKSVQDVLELRINLNGQRASLLVALMLPSGPEQEANLREVTEFSRDNDRTLARLKDACITDPELSAKVEALVSARTEYIRARDEQIIPMIRGQKADEAKALILGTQAERFHTIRSLSREFTRILDARSEVRLTRMQWLFGSLGAGALITAFWMAIGLERLIATPLTQLSAIAGKIAEGELGIEVVGASRTDEIGVLNKAFHRMSRSLAEVAGRAKQIAGGDLTAEVRPQSTRDVLGNAFADMAMNLRNIIQELSRTVKVLSSSASQIMASTSELASSATETASAVTQTTATIEEVKQTSRHSSEKARLVSEQSQAAAQDAHSAKDALAQTINVMAGIRSQMGVVADSILGLSAQSHAIAEIISTVDDLASQSKLLAVNAAIEAAKAGEEGKGFSVVAQEVKALAEQSTQATSRVREILNDIQKATGKAVMATEQGNKAVEAGVRQSQVAGESIARLADAVADSADAATQIAATSQQQFVGMEQVALAMENIKDASTSAVASTRQMESAAHQLHELGQELRHLVEKFKV